MASIYQFLFIIGTAQTFRKTFFVFASLDREEEPTYQLRAQNGSC